MIFYWTLQKLAKYAPSYRAAITVEATAEIWLKEQVGLIVHSTLPSFWEDIPEIEECWEEYYMQGCPVCHLGSYYGRRIIDLRRI